MQLGVNMPAQANRKLLHDKTDAAEVELFEVYDVVLYLGIIDILQEYNVRKKLEHTYKSLQFDPMSISVIEPKLYSTRFIKFLEKVFPITPWRFWQLLAIVLFTLLTLKVNDVILFTIHCKVIVHRSKNFI